MAPQIVTLRAATPDDLELLRSWHRHPHVIAAVGDDDWGWERELNRHPPWREQLIAEVAGHPIGFLEIIDPSLARSNTFFPFLLPSSVGIRPEAGLMILFPSYVAHSVHVQKGSGTRISVAFNVRKEPFP